MIFLSLLMDLLLMLGGAGAFATADGGSVFVPPEHRTHGHLPGPPNNHSGNTTHIHHGSHGHTVTGSFGGGNHQTPPHIGG